MAESKPRLAGHIQIERHGSKASLMIDGEPFPWFIREAGVQPGPVDEGDIPAVCIEILAETVTMTNDLDGHGILPS